MNLSQRPPRSARCRLGGYALLPRLLDKCRAELAGTNGDYHYNCPLDQHFMNFAGIEAEELKGEVAKGKGDGEILEWITAHAKYRRTPSEIAHWSTWRDGAVPTDTDSRSFFNKLHRDAGQNRNDIATWPDVLDLDDYVSFGGKA